MDLIKKTITIHGGREIHVLTPVKVNCNITSGHDNKGFTLILGNGSGYQYLAECFAIAGELQKNEILYIPIQFNGNNEFKQAFGDFDYNMNIICTNYCETQFSCKDIVKLLQVKVFSELAITRSPTINRDYLDKWKTEKRLTVKTHKRYLFITTNREGFSSLACGASDMADYGDDEKFNEFPPHQHYDWGENTSASVGVTLYYWHNK